jgi:two-component system NtrC family sensor kinase
VSAAILVLEPSLTLRMDLAARLEGEGWRPLPCATAHEALEALAREPVALAIVDGLLTDGASAELLAALGGRPGTPHVPLLLLVGEAELQECSDEWLQGADERVSKPYDAERLLERVRGLCPARAAEAPAAAAVRSVLLIEDSATYRAALAARLEAAGYRVLEAASGEAGLALAASERPAALVIDGMLPGIDGAAVIQRLRLDSALRGTPCVLLSASERREDELRALDAGADAFARKGEELDGVLARIEAVLRGGGAPANGTASLQGPKRILAVDDSPSYLHALTQNLTDQGYACSLASSGEQALELLATQAVDCVLLDLLMPGLSGAQTCRRIKASPATREIPLILLTACEDHTAMIDGLGAGADDFIAKSSEFEVVQARVRVQLRRKQFEDENRRVREQLLDSERTAAAAQAARELAQTKAVLIEQLERKNAELEAFTYSVSHDLRAPLRSIDGFSRALLEDAGAQLSAGGQAHLQRVFAAVRRMQDLIDGLLELSRTSRAELRRTPLDLSALARQLLEELARAQPQRRVQVEIEAGLSADADPKLTCALLANLFDNAWKFTSRSSEPRISFGRASTPKPSFFVRDNGAGFDMQYASRLFAPFQRLHSASEFSGMGIGLATVQRIVERHGGRVWAESAVDQGTTIYFTLVEATVGENG